MLSLIRSLFNPLLSLVFVVLATAYFVTFTTLLIKNNGHSEQIVGAMHSAYYAGMFMSAFLCEVFVRTLGYRNAFILSALTTSITMLFMGILNDQPMVWIAMRFIAGGCMGLIYIVIETWLLSFSTAVTRGQILAIYTITLYFSQAFGQYFIDFIPEGSHVPFLSSAFISGLAVIPLVCSKLKINMEENKKESSITEWGNMFFLAPLGILGGVCSGILLSGVYSFIPIFAVDYEVSPSLLLSLTIFGGVIWQWPLGWLSDRFSRDMVLMATSLLTAIPALSILFFPSYWNIILNSFLLGGFIFTIYPQSIAHVTVDLPEVSFSSIAALLLMAYGVGSTLGPMIAAQMVHFFGSIALYAFFAFWGISLALFGWLQKSEQPAEEIL